MSFGKRHPRVRARVTQSAFGSRRPTAVRGAGANLACAIVIAVLAVVATAWALFRHETTRPPPLWAPRAPTAVPTYDPDAGEIPAPEVVGD